MSKIKWDSSQVDALGADLSMAPGRIQRSAGKVLETGAFKIKRNMKRLASGHDYLPSLDAHVSYDRLALLHYEIGFDKVGQGNLANFAAYGSVNNAPVMDHTAALRMEAPEIMRHLGDAGAAAVFGKQSYTTKSGKTRYATPAQIANWTRGSRG